MIALPPLRDDPHQLIRDLPTGAAQQPAVTDVRQLPASLGPERSRCSRQCVPERRHNRMHLAEQAAPGQLLVPPAIRDRVAGFGLSFMPAGHDAYQPA